jgi:ATP-dependent Clp protease ATP-binding subunit ClpC
VAFTRVRCAPSMPRPTRPVGAPPSAPPASSLAVSLPLPAPVPPRPSRPALSPRDLIDEVNEARIRLHKS